MLCNGVERYTVKYPIRVTWRLKIKSQVRYFWRNSTRKHCIKGNIHFRWRPVFRWFYFQVWDISCYCLNSSEHKTTPAALLPRKLWSVNRRNSASRPGTIDTKPPPLVVTFRAHLKPVVSLDFVDSRQFIISASTDASVRLWTQTGRYIGNIQLNFFFPQQRFYHKQTILQCVSCHWRQECGWIRETSYQYFIMPE